MAGGAPLQCGWLKDSSAPHWLIPSALGRLMRVKDAAQSQRVMQAMMKTIKIDIAGLERAATAHEASSLAPVTQRSKDN